MVNPTQTRRYRAISQSWWRNWPRIIPFFDYPPEIRKVIYTTTSGLRDIIRICGRYELAHEQHVITPANLRKTAPPRAIPVRIY